MSDLYRETLLEHARRPRNRGQVLEPSFTERATNASCGDALELSVRLDGKGLIEDCKFEGRGCALSQAAASLLTQSVLGKSAEEVLAMRETDMVGWLGVDPGPLRQRCASLPLFALQQGFHVWIKDSSSTT